MRRIVYFGNCQMYALQGLHRRFVTPVSGDIVSWVNPYALITHANRAAIAAADLIIGQVADKESNDWVTDLESPAPRHRVPTIGGTFLWPFAGQAHINHLKHGMYVGDLGDGFMNRMIKQGVPPDEAVQRYLDLDLNTVVNLDRLLEVNLDQQRDRDALTDYRFADWVAERFRDEYLFLTPYHLNLALARTWTLEIWQRIGVEAEALALLEQQLTWTPFPPAARPIHPFVIRHFGLRFMGDEPRFHFPVENTSVTFREYARRYMRSEWNESLDEAVRLGFVRHADAALEKLQAGVEQNPGSVDGVRLLSDRLVQLKRPGEAIAIVRRAIALDPAEPYQYLRLAALLQGVGDLASAEAAIRKAIEVAPGTGVSHRRLSHMLMAQGQMTEAEAEARTAVALEPQTPDNFAHLATVLMRTDQLDAAEVALRRSVALGARGPDPHLGLSQLLRLQGKFDAAIDAAKTALEIMPAHVQAYYQLSIVQEAAGRTDDAEATLRRGIDALPRWAPRVYIWLGGLLARLQRPDDAIAAFRAAIALEPANVEAWSRLFEVLERAGRTHEAEAALHDAIAAAPENARFHHRMSFVLEGKGDLDGALQSALRAVDLNRSSAEFHFRHSQLLAHHGKPGPALDAIRRAVALHPADATFNTFLGHLLANATQYEEAEAAFVQALKFAPDRPGPLEALERVRTLRAGLQPQTGLADPRPSVVSTAPEVTLATGQSA